MSERLTVRMWEPVQAHKALTDLVFECLRYDEETGRFYWKMTPNGRVKSGQEAGVVDRSGYRRIMLRGKSYMAHHLAWLFTFGYWPEQAMDHVNRDRADNRIVNLRLVTRSQNMQNTGIRKDNKSGVRGVYWSSAEKKWKAQIRCNGVRRHLGTFASLDDAATTVIEARRTFFTHSPEGMA